ncbi:MAG: DUF6537 domain-containing protein [Elusimicrobiota bacterium]
MEKLQDSIVFHKQDRIDPRFLKESGFEVFTGNELLVKGFIEAGVGLVTGYPGSPVSDVFDTIHEISPYLAEKGMVAQIANNEALSTARLNGARQAGLRAVSVMKSVGLHVAADALAVGNLMEHHKPAGGAIVVVGDDPWNETTQINSDSRYLSKHLHMPVIEPSSFQELKDWIPLAFKISGNSDLYITYVVTTNQADGGARVQVFSHPELAISQKKQTTLSSEKISIKESVLIPPHTSQREATLEDRFHRALAEANVLALNQWLVPPEDKNFIGFISSGLSAAYLEEVLTRFGLWGKFPVLKLGMTYPIDETKIAELASKVGHIIVVEEKRGFVESQVAEILIHLHQKGVLSDQPALWGKKFPNTEKGFPERRGLNASLIMEILGSLFLKWKDYIPSHSVGLIERELTEILNTKSSSIRVPLRTPTFCPGCPHRDSSAVNLKMKKNFLNKKKPLDIIFHGESGCHSMLQFAPNEGLMQNYSGMGLGGGTGAGMSPFITNKQVVFLGDSTFFHSGLIAISDSVKNNQDITYIILENKTTAMTGHQPTPGNDFDVMDRETDPQDIERVVKGLVPAHVFVKRIDPADRNSYQPLLEETVLKPGVKVIIADKECAITYHRRLNAEKKQTIKEKGYIAREERMNITPEVCEFCLECTRQTGCPGLTIAETPYGKKIATDLSTCVDDGACARTKACPSFEKVIIQRSQAVPPKKSFQINPAELPVVHFEEFGDRWSAYTAGVGGMGAGLVNSVLVRAASLEGKHVTFLDKKGLAIRNGAVYGHIVISKTEPICSPVIPYGKADLLIGLDILESARAVDAELNLRVAHPGRTYGVINRHKHETVLSLMGRESFDPDELEVALQKKIRLGGLLSIDFSDISEEYLGSKLYSNMILLGAAYQKGWIPLEEKNLNEAICLSVRSADRQTNLHAFLLGRYLSCHPDRIKKENLMENFYDLVNQKKEYLKKSSLVFGRVIANQYQQIMHQIDRWLDVDLSSRLLLAHTVYDLIRYENVAFAERYVEIIWNLYKKDQKKFNFELTKKTIWSLYKVLAIKDEVWVAQLLIAPEKYQRDKERYQIDESRGDKISYVHFNRPQFNFWGKLFEFDLESKDWMLRIMSYFKFLRKILPQWHKKEKEFRDWYLNLIEGIHFTDSLLVYKNYCDLADLPEMVKGYREIRYPLMKEAQEKAIKIQSALSEMSPKETLIQPLKVL